jgi:hypothetical protein
LLYQTLQTCLLRTISAILKKGTISSTISFGNLSNIFEKMELFVIKKNKKEELNEINLKKKENV